MDVQNDTGTTIFWSVDNRTITFDLDAPILNISTPNGTLGYGEPGIELDLNWSVSDNLLGLATSTVSFA